MQRAPLVILAGLALAVPGASAGAQPEPSWRGADVTVSGFAWRPLRDRREPFQPGLALAWGPTSATGDGPGRFTSLVQFELSMFDPRSYAVGLSAAAFEAAARLGLFEPEARLGVALATIDTIDGQWSAELLSPRAEVGLGVRVGHWRVSLGVQGEYLWRWFGPSILERGVVLDVRYEKLVLPPDLEDQ